LRKSLAFGPGLQKRVDRIHPAHHLPIGFNVLPLKTHIPEKLRPSFGLRTPIHLSFFWQRFKAINSMKRILLLTFFVSAFIPSFSRITSGIDTFHYEVKMVPSADRTDLEVYLHYQASADSFHLLGLRRDYYGTPRIYDYLQNMKGENGTVVKPSAIKGDFQIKPNQQSRVQLRYKMSYDPEKVQDATYSPNTNSTYFHAAICQWMLTLPSHLENAIYHITIEYPAGWTLYSSAAFDKREFFISGPFNQIFSTVIGASRNTQKTYWVNGRPLRVFISGTYSIPKAEILAAIHKIFVGQRKWFNDFEFPFFTVTILPREDNVAGIRINNMFLCHLKKEVTKLQLLNLVSHEMFHVWLGGKISVKRKEDYAHRSHWFTEGYNDYFARRLLLDMQLISQKQFVTEINNLLKLTEENPYKNYNYSQLKNLADSGKYGTPATKLQYYRGAIMALNADYELGKENKSLKQLIRQLHSYAKTKGFEPVPENELFDFMKKGGLDMEADFEKYIIRGESIEPLPKAMGPGYTVKTLLLPKFYLGFKVGQNNLIDSVDQKGPAYKAGIRKGMLYTNSENTNLFSNAWDPAQPAKITVQENGAEREIRYHPKGEMIAVKQYVPVR
jgi:predicted metalloprotease with PDZ domain